MRICLQMLYTKSWMDIAKIVCPNVVNFCIKHGYSWNMQWLQEPYDAFEKIRHIQRLFAANEADAVMSLDADILITNYTKKVEDFLDDKHDIYFAEDLNGINCGTFIVKDSCFSKMFLERSLSVQGYPKVYCEQDAFNHILNVPYTYLWDKVKILPHPSINSFKYELYPEIGLQTEDKGQWVQDSSFILHLAALGMKTRFDILNEMKQYIVYD